jgi:hypothetical protein
MSGVASFSAGDRMPTRGILVRLLRARRDRPRARFAESEKCRREQLEQISTAALPAPVPDLHCASSKPRLTREV